MNVHILIVDDEEEIREMLSRHFRYLGYSVSTAGNGKEALEELSKTKIDIVISDISMPEMDGVALLRIMRTDYPTIRPIMITGYVTLENALSCLRYGAETCVFKPLEDLSELEEAVTQVVRRIQRWHKILGDLQRMKL